MHFSGVMRRAQSRAIFGMWHAEVSGTFTVTNPTGKFRTIFIFVISATAEEYTCGRAYTRVQIGRKFCTTMLSFPTENVCIAFENPSTGDALVCT